MRFPRPLVAGRFVSRDNRFRATVEVGGERVFAHVPNSGRLWELLTPGAEVHLLPAFKPGRVTPYDLTLVRTPTGWVCIDARLPPRLLGEWLAKGGGGPLAGWLVEKSEVRYGASRLDLLLRRGDERCWAETKSVTLVRDGVAVFPDAPTARGRRHLMELQRLARDGTCAAAVFVVQREDAARFRPNDDTDPEFGAALREAAASGVKVLCVRCRVDEGGVEVVGEVTAHAQSPISPPATHP